MPGLGRRMRTPAVVLGCRLLAAQIALVPLGLLVADFLLGRLGPDPGPEVTEALGIAAFQLLLVTLAMTPLQRWTGWPGWIRMRRMLGLFCFFYALLHLLAFLQFILGWQDLWSTFTKRPYIIAGSIALLILIPLAATSTKGMMRRLGRRWKSLHRGIYLATLAAWVHFIWQARSDIGEMVAYGLVVLLLLGVRVWWWQSARAGIPKAGRV